MSAFLAQSSFVLSPLFLLGMTVIGPSFTSPSPAEVRAIEVQVPNALGWFEVVGLVPTNDITLAHPDVRDSENWYIRDVELNGEPLFEDVDYMVVDDGSNKGVVIFFVPLQLGDQIRITGATFEPGPHRGGIDFS